MEHLLTVLAYCMEIQVSSKGVKFDDLDEYINRDDIVLLRRRPPKTEEQVIQEEGEKQLANILAIPGAKRIPIDESVT